MSDQWTFWVSMDFILAMVAILAWHFGGRIAIRRYMARAAADARRARLNAPSFRRPAEFGPLCVSRARVEAMRLAIVADQLQPAADGESTVAHERAEFAESTAVDERAVISESTVPRERAEPVESTVVPERVGPWLAGLRRAVAEESTVARERTLFWLESWRDNGGLFGATGAAA